MMFLYNSENSKYKFENFEAFDLAIKMKVLPKFHGTRQKLEKPIIELLKVLKVSYAEAEQNNGGGSDTKEDSKKDKDFIKDLKEGKIEITIPEIVNNNSNNKKEIKLELKIDNKEIKTNYPHTVKKLLEMLYKLRTQGFASFM